MKNYKFVLIALALIFSLNSVSAELVDYKKVVEELRNFSTDGTLINSSNLHKGVSNSDVAKLQEFLIDSSYLNITKPTGFFGTQTETAVKNFQDQVGLKPDGIVGNQTIDILKLEPYVPDARVITDIVANTETKTEVNPVNTDTIISVSAGCKDGYKFNTISGSPCPTINPINPTVTTTTPSTPGREDENSRDLTPRIMFWYGKVNQHIDANGNWQTDPDGKSGAGNFKQFGNEGYGDRKLEYCKKWYPNTKSFTSYKLETISTWKERFNRNNWTSTKLSFVCLSNPV